MTPKLSSLSYWTLTGANEAGKITTITDNIDEIMERTYEGVTTLIETFGKQETPYYSLPRANHIPRFNDYEHLARTAEWSALDDADNAEVA